MIGVKTGLIVGSSWLDRWQKVAVAAIFGIGLYLLVLIFGAHQQVLVTLLDRYTFVGSLLMAVLLIYLGLQQEAEQGSCFKQDGGPEQSWGSEQGFGSGQGSGPEQSRGSEQGFKSGRGSGLNRGSGPNRGSGSNRGSGPNQGGRYKYYIGFLPCPLCLAALAFSVIVIGPVLDLPPAKLGLSVAAFFIVLVLAVASVMGRLVHTVKFNPATVFNNVLLVFGVATLVFALLIPNFVQSMAMPLAPLAVGSPHLAGLVLVGMAVFGALGYMMDYIYYAKDCDKV